MPDARRTDIIEARLRMPDLRSLLRETHPDVTDSEMDAITIHVFYPNSKGEFDREAAHQVLDVEVQEVVVTARVRHGRLRKMRQQGNDPGNRAGVNLMKDPGMLAEAAKAKAAGNSGFISIIEGGDDD